LAVPGIETFDRFFITEAMEQDEFAGGDDWPAEPLAGFLLPEFWRAFFWPSVSERGSGTDTVAIGAEELRPVGSGGGMTNDQETQ
jgi:hypothetical protein